MVSCLLISVVFVGSGVLLARYDTVVIGGLGVIVSAGSLLPRKSYLELQSEGFLVCTLFRKTFVRWSDVQEFFPTNNSKVGWNYLPSYGEVTMSRKLARAISGIEATLPDKYGMKAGDLAGLMNELRIKHAK